jgi:hypothetical protein
MPVLAKSLRRRAGGLPIVRDGEANDAAHIVPGRDQDARLHRPCRRSDRETMEPEAGADDEKPPPRG